MVKRAPMSWRDRRGKLDVKVSPYLYIAPFFLLFLITGLFPNSLHGLRVYA